MSAKNKMSKMDELKMKGKPGSDRREAWVVERQLSAINAVDIPLDSDTEGIIRAIDNNINK